MIKYSIFIQGGESMKKIISILLLTVMCAMVFVGCGSNPLSEVEKAEDVVTYLEEQGLPIVYKIQYTSQNDPNGSGSHEYISRANFSDSTIEDTYDTEQPESGAVELFETAEKAEKRAKALKEYQGANPLAYMILKDKILLRMNTYADKEIVEKYAKALGAQIYSEPSESNKMLQAAPIKNGVFDVSPNDFADIINQYIQDEAPIKNLSKLSSETKDFYIYNIDAYNRLTFVTDETKEKTEAIWIEYDYLSDSKNEAKAGSYFAWIMMACDKKMNEDLGLQIMHDLNMFNMKDIGSYISTHNGVTYFLNGDTEKITILIRPEESTL